MKLLALLLITFVVFVAWTASPVSFAADGRSITAVNSQVEAAPGGTYDTLSTVNG